MLNLNKFHPRVSRYNLITTRSRGLKIYSFYCATKKLLVNKTRGFPSTSTNLKEALCEKIPLYYDLLRGFRQEYGSAVVSQITVNDLYNGLSGVTSIVKETSEIDPNTGIAYRGLTIPEILKLLPLHGNYPSPESIFWLLLTGDIPTELQTASLTSDWANRREKQKFFLNEPRIFLQSLPKNVAPVTKLAIVLTAFDSSDKQLKTSSRNSTTSICQWENAFEESMDLLAILPAIVAIIKNPDTIKYSTAPGDWVDFLFETLKDSGDKTISKESSTSDFLRLIITLNADEDGGTPSNHVGQILGSCQRNPRKALAAAFMVLASEPASGTLFQCMKFQEKVHRLLVTHQKEDVLRGIIGAFMKNPSSFPGFRVSAYCDPRFHILREFAEKINGASSTPEIKLALDISKTVQSISTSESVKLKPEMNSLAAPLFKHHGFYDMDFSQTLICMSRAMGLLASIIWSKIINLPVEHPTSTTSHTQVELFRRS